MKESYQTRLQVNDKDIELHPFVEELLGGIVTGGVRTLKGAEEPRTIELKAAGKSVGLVVNGQGLTLTQFPNDILLKTVKAVVSSLKGVDSVRSLQVDVKVSRKK